MSAAVVEFDVLRDSRHRDAASAREQADWLAWLELGGTAARTLEDYEWATARGMRMFPDRAFAEFTDGDLLHVARSFPVKSRRVRMEPYKSWFKWGVKTRRIEKNPMDLLPDLRQPPQPYIDVFSDTDVAALTSLPIRDGALMALLFGTGIRKGEARRLRARDVLLDRRDLIVRGGKGGKDRVVSLIEPGLVEALADLFLVEGLGPADHLWYSVRANELTRKVMRREPVGDGSFHRWWARCLADAEVVYRKPHTSRHTFATRWRRRGADLDDLKRELGHSSIRTTSDLYVHIRTTETRARMLALLEAGEK